MIGIHNAWLLLVVHLSTKVTFVTSGPEHEVFILALQQSNKTFQKSGLASHTIKVINLTEFPV